MIQNSNSSETNLQQKKKKSSTQPPENKKRNKILISEERKTQKKNKKVTFLPSLKSCFTGFFSLNLRGSETFSLLGVFSFFPSQNKLVVDAEYLGLRSVRV